jgi:hypothetical protein
MTKRGKAMDFTAAPDPADKLKRCAEKLKAAILRHPR